MEQVKITVTDGGDDGDAAAELRSLLGWLLREDDLETPRLAPAVPAEGEMGALADTILLLVSANGMAVLRSAVKTWLRQRRANVEVTIRTPDGETSLKINGLPASGAVGLAYRSIEQADRSAERAPDAE
ncbi:hypothetical protein [Allokutzneria sp. NRRL B-24872]|uniref:effector-associated constant component EACC1 n=1 Tax=Allokutzneria sp. NRRL B-24872 TaxID=1137961 RepID=UPI000A389BFB|nr:hypothetical protein [Allokutzneria sp. NRRL B-24872]